MTISRALANAMRDDLETPDGADALIAFLRIEHPALSDDIRLVSDVFDYSWNGELWTGLPFDFVLLNDDDEMPQTGLSIPNVDRRIGIAIRALDVRPKCSLSLLSSADFDLNEDPRTAPGATTTIYSFTQFDLLSVKGDAASVVGRVILRDYGQEPWPGLRATASRCPGLFA